MHGQSRGAGGERGVLVPPLASTSLIAAGAPFVWGGG